MQLGIRQSGFSFIKFLLPIVLLAGGVMVFQYLTENKASTAVPAPKEKTWSVQVAELQAGRYAPEIQVQGRVEAPDRYRAAAPGAGWVEAVNVREGDQVQAGDILIKLDPRDFTTALTQAQAELADIKAQLVESEIRNTQDQAALVQEKSILNLTEKSLTRSKRLKKQSLSSESDLEAAQQNLMRQQLLVNQRELAVKSYQSRKQQLEARLQRTQAQLDQAQRALQRSISVAPYDGVVSQVNVAVGGRVSAGKEMLVMYSPATLEVRALIPNQYQGELAQALENTQQLKATRISDGSEYLLVRLAGEASPGGMDAFLRPVSPTEVRISPGGLVTLMLERPEQANLYPVPPSAIYNNTRVYLLQEGRLAGVSVDIVGQSTLQGESVRLVRSDAIEDGAVLVLTRLPNASTGLKAKAVSAGGK